MYAKAGAAGLCRRRRSEDDGSDVELLPGGYGNGPMTPLQMVEEVNELKERLGGDAALKILVVTGHLKSATCGQLKSGHFEVVS